MIPPWERKFFRLEGHVPVAVPLGDFADAMIGIQVAHTELKGGDVSTVFLGIDHRFFGEGPPILFESMVFGGALDREQVRYCTWEEAEAGHAKLVARVKGEDTE